MQYHEPNGCVSRSQRQSERSLTFRSKIIKNRCQKNAQKCTKRIKDLWHGVADADAGAGD